MVVRSISRDGVKMQVPVAVDTENGDWLAESRGIDSTLLRTNSVTRRIISVNAQLIILHRHHCLRYLSNVDHDEQFP